MRRLIGVVISLSILTAIFLKIDIKEFILSIRGMNILFLVVSLLFFIPQTYVSARRWQLILLKSCPIGLWKSVSLILAGSTLNVVLPSKIGDFAKAFFLKKSDGLGLNQGFSFVVFEKVLDVASLCLVLLVGALLVPQRSGVVDFAIVFSLIVVFLAFLMFYVDLRNLLPEFSVLKKGVGAKLLGFLDEWQEALRIQKKNRKRLAFVVFLSVFLWFLHVGQIYFFFLALNSSVSPVLVFAFVPITIFVGLIPISFGGIGTRDAALIYLFSPYESPSVMAAVGILCSLRYFVPALLGLPFLSRLGFGQNGIKREKVQQGMLQ
jgi:uncharacterized protein (TIRG00374 family)